MSNEAESSGRQSDSEGGVTPPGGHPPRRQLRLAVVMTGGVSLCVWMGGVALEIDRLRRSRCGEPAGNHHEPDDRDPYGPLLNVLGVEPLIDIVAGTSAGGLNGTLLAAAIAWGTDLTGLGPIWFSLADFKALMRPASSSNPPSLLEGDDYFLPQIEQVLQQMSTSFNDPTTHLASRTSGHPDLHLIVNTTVITPTVDNFVDDNGVEFSESTNVGRFHFHQDDFTIDEPVATTQDPPGIVQALARAARSSASFPGAFEASYVTVGSANGDLREDMVDFGVSRFALDGGLVDNAPLDVVLETIASQPATGPVSRSILFVDPLGSTFSTSPADDPTKPPSVYRVLDHALMIPRQRSNALLYDQLHLRAGQHRVLRDVRNDLLGGYKDQGLSPSLITTAEKLLATADRLAPGVRSARRRLDPSDDSPDGDGLTARDQARTRRQTLLIVQDFLGRALADTNSGLATDLMVKRESISALLLATPPARGEVSESADVGPPVTRAMTALVPMLFEPYVDVDNRALKQLQNEMTLVAALALADKNLPPDALKDRSDTLELAARPVGTRCSASVRYRLRRAQSAANQVLRTEYEYTGFDENTRREAHRCPVHALRRVVRVLVASQRLDLGPFGRMLSTLRNAR